MIYKCLKLFNLLPTSQPHRWLIAADWLEENNRDVTANAFRENVFKLPISNIIDFNGGFGSGKGNGFGSNFVYGDNVITLKCFGVGNGGGYGGGFGGCWGNGSGDGYGRG